MDTKTFNDMKAVQERHHAELMRIPGVHGTSIGLKEVDGKTTDIFAIRIHLVRKRHAGELSATQLVPREIEGFPTDLVEHDQPEPYEDGSKQRPVLGGCQLAVSNWHGTLGCIVKGPDGMAYALSNQHVLSGVNSGVFQPKTDPVCDKIGDTKKSILSALIDAAYCSLDAYDVSYKAEILEIGAVAGSRIVGWSDLPLAVRKRGRTTGLTNGSMTGLNWRGRRSDGWDFMGQQYITASAGVAFCAPGDSGSVVVDSDIRVVGLLWGGALPNGGASAIENVMAGLEVVVATPSMVDAPRPYEETTLGRLEALLSESNAGRAYWKSFLRHRARVRHLFHQTPRLHAVWLKMPQAKLMEVVRDAVTNPDAIVPARINGDDTAALLGKLRRAMTRSISDEQLRRDIDSLYERIVDNVGAPWRQMLGSTERSPEEMGL